jgi:hypothetical protein
VLRCRKYIDNVTLIVVDLNKLIKFADAAWNPINLVISGVIPGFLLMIVPIKKVLVPGLGNTLFSGRKMPIVL